MTDDLARSTHRTPEIFVGAHVVRPGGEGDGHDTRLDRQRDAPLPAWGAQAETQGYATNRLLDGDPADGTVGGPKGSRRNLILRAAAVINRDYEAARARYRLLVPIIDLGKGSDTKVVK